MITQYDFFPYMANPVVKEKYYEAERFLKRTLSKTKYSAKNIRGLEFDITIRNLMNLYIEQNGKCALTGWDLEFTRGGNFNGTNPRAATIDRINNYSGYRPWNIQLTCWMPNCIKNSLDNRNFIDLCKNVVTKNLQ